MYIRCISSILCDISAAYKIFIVITSFIQGSCNRLDLYIHTSSGFHHSPNPRRKLILNVFLQYILIYIEESSECSKGMLQLNVSNIYSLLEAVVFIIAPRRKLILIDLYRGVFRVFKRNVAIKR